MPGPSPTPVVVRFPVALLAAAVVYVLLAARQHAFTVRHAVDVMFWDTWELYDPMFDGNGWWASFDQQHGPHRQGLGGLLMRAMAARSRWDSRDDALAVSWTLIAAAPLGVLLAWRCGARGWALVAVPPIYLNVRQYQMFVASANPAHGALPVLLLTAYGLAWFAPRPAVRLAGVAGLTACAIFTGFALFIGLLTPALLLAELRGARGDRRRQRMILAALTATTAAWIAFAIGYRFDQAASGVRFLVPHPVEYLYFVAVMFANLVGWPGVGPDAIGVGTILALLLVAVCLAHGRRVARAGATTNPTSVALFSLAAFGIMYAAHAALGRTSVGWRTGVSSRYVTLCIPVSLALLLCLATAADRRARRLAVGCGVLLVAGTLALRPADLAEVDWAHDGCLRWREAYLLTRDQTAADRLSQFLIYPKPELAARLDYLRQHRLNLFDDAVFGPDPAPVDRPAPNPSTAPVTPRGTGGR